MTTRSIKRKYFHSIKDFLKKLKVIFGIIFGFNNKRLKFKIMENIKDPNTEKINKNKPSNPEDIKIDNDIISFNGEGEIKESENAVPPKAWNNQQKAYNDAWENNKNKQIDDDL